MAAGKAKTVTRAARRVITPALDPGSLRQTGDGRTSRRLAENLRRVCKYYANAKIPDFSSNTAPLDRWLQQSLSDERTGFLSAFVDQASMIQSNLHYRLVGSRSLVSRTLDLLHASEGGEGFRKLIKMTALNFYSSNFGGGVYLDRTDPVIASYLPNSEKWYWTTPPVQAMYATDSTMFAMNSDYVYPYTYDGEFWSRYDFFKVVSMPSTILRTWGVGRCPLYRCIQIARMTSATYEHIYNTLSPDTAKGIITIKGMTGEEFLAAMSGSEAVNEEDEVFKSGFVNGDELGDIVVLADREEEIAVKFVTLSRLPDGFFIDQWVRWTLTSFATNLGFPLDEFIGMPTNTLLGQSGAQVQQNAQRGATKGGRDFVSGFQDNLQALVIPDTVSFAFSERDQGEELTEIQLLQAKATLVATLFQATQLAIINKGDENVDTHIEAQAQGQHLITRDEGRRLLSELNVVPWLTEQAHPNVTIDDQTYDISTQRVKRLRDEYRDTRQIQRLAANPMQGEPVVMYDNFVDKSTGFVRENTTVLWDDSAELARPTNWTGFTAVTNGFHDTPGPNDFKKRRTGRKTISLSTAVDSDHTSDITRLLRKAMFAVLEDETAEPLDRKSVDALTSRIYAIVQMGRDSLGNIKLTDPQMAEVVSDSLSFARGRVKALLGMTKAGKGNTPMTPPLEASLVEDMANVIKNAQHAADEMAGTVDKAPDELMHDLIAEAARPRARLLAEDEATFAFHAGKFIAAQASKPKRKVWVGGLCRCGEEHNIDEEAVAFTSKFSNGEFWPGQQSGCSCDCIVVF